MSASRADLALTGGTIYVSPTDEPIANGLLLINGVTIAAVGRAEVVRVPRDARVIDCSGLTITAGFWNSHVHFFERKWTNAASIPAPELARQIAGMLTSYGFTTVFDLGSMWANTRDLRNRIESGEVPGPRIRSTGEGLVSPGALPSDQILGMMGVMKFAAPEIADAGQAASAARKLLDEGVDGIKLFISSPRGPALAVHVVEAAVKEAHRAGKPVFLHPNTGADVLMALRAGVDVIAHTTPHSGPWDDAILAAIAERRVALTPTLKLWKQYARHDRASAQDKIVETQRAQLRAWIDQGGIVHFGTDLGAAEYDPTDEYELMHEAGMSFRDVLASLTTAPAEQFGTRSGRIEEGFDADVVVLNGDPSTDIRALADVRFTLRGGRIIHPLRGATRRVRGGESSPVSATENSSRS